MRAFRVGHGAPMIMLSKHSKFPNLTLALILLSGLVGLWHVLPDNLRNEVEPVAHAATLTVNTSDDHNDGVCNAADCTFREAINAANTGDTISFNIAGSGVRTIKATSGFNITKAITIDGTTQPGFAVPLIELDGVGVVGNGLSVNAPNVIIKGLIINRFSGYGISFDSFGNSSVQGCYIGTNAMGTAASANGGGIHINAPGITIGGTTGGAGNLISGNIGSGITVTGGSGTSILGNFIGLNAGGTYGISNGSAGVEILGGSAVVGGAVPGSRNVISGNNSGIIFAQGLKPAQAIELRIGVLIEGGSGSQVVGNFIGTDPTETGIIPNDYGVVIDGAANSLIGGTTPAAGNIIKGSVFDGVAIEGPPATKNVVKSNLIAANGFNGVSVGGGASNNQIGGTELRAGNTITGNGNGGFFGSNGGGVRIDGGSGNAVLGNSIFSNSLLGIDLGPFGVTANDNCESAAGPNINPQNFPVITSASADSTTTSIRGTLNSTPNTQFRIEFFANSACDPSGNGEGQHYLGFVNTTTDSSCQANFTFVVPNASVPGSSITATATDSNNNTSEFSACAPNGTHSISGRLFFSGLGSQPPVAGANVMLSGSASGTATTDGSGFYSFNNLPDGGTYTITVPQQVGFRFLPVGGYTFANLSSDQTANFERVPIYSVSGRVTDTNGSGVPNAELTLRISGCNGPNPLLSLKATTDANGNYDFGDVGPADIKFSYAISFALDPQKAGYSFAPDFVPQAFTPFRNQPAIVVINFTATYQGEHWKATGSLNAARAGQTATLLNNGKVLVAGGSSDPTSAELYDPGPGAWSTTGSLNLGRTAATATLLPNGKVLVVSGNTAEIYDPASGTWSLTGNLNASHTQPTASLLANGKVLIAGGATATSELYDPTSGVWTITGSLNSVRSGHTATLLTNGDVLVVSGTSAELYNPASGTWKLIGTLTTPRSGHTATLLGNGQVLVAGGDANGFPHETNSAELYDPPSGTWRSTSSLNSVRSHHAAVLLPNGTVLVTGGDGVVHQCDGVLASAEIYDPGSETWTSAGLMSYERSHHTATFLATGMVLLTGGTDTKGQLVNASELFTSYGISGRVTAEGNGLRDVTVTLSGDANAVTWTDANGNYSFSNLNLNGSYTVTATKGGFNFLPPSQMISSLNTSLTFDFVATATTAATPFIQFSSPSYTVSEGAPAVTIAIVRMGDTSGNSSIDFATNDAGLANCAGNNGVASQRCDYISTAGAIQFSAGEAFKFVSVPIVDDSYREVNETFTVNLINPSGAVLGNPANATITIVDNEVMSSNGPNPIVGPNFFVRQHYLDFLNRQPDPDGFAFWINQLTSCGPDTSCVEIRRINVSASFFLSIEFQQTGYLVERMYQAAFGTANGSSTLNGVHTLPVPIVRFNEFLPDTQRIGRGVVVGQGNWEQQLENNKNAFAGEFVQRSRFMTAFPTTLLPAQFVDALFTNAGVTPTATDRNAAIAEFGSATNTTNLAARGRVLRDVAENSTLNSQEFNRAFVLMQYFGYLRRNPNDAPDSDYSGYEFWLNKLDSFNGDFAKAEMVKAFISSSEYRARFGP